MAGTKNSASLASVAEVRERYRNTANQWMAEASTLVLLSRLMGAIPDECSRSTGKEQFCTWRTTSHTFGHGTLMVWIKAKKRKRIRLYCTLPADGSPRAPNSCHAEVGA